MSTLVINSTGSGKSLCYQLPAYIYAKSRSPCITLVISPLLSLMDDQLSNFPSCVKGECLLIDQTKSERKDIMRRVAEGAVHVLMLTPEALEGGALWRGGPLPRIAFACIDEVHCVSEMSHNFRTSYFRIYKVPIVSM